MTRKLVSFFSLFVPILLLLAVIVAVHHTALDSTFDFAVLKDYLEPLRFGEVQHPLLRAFAPEPWRCGYYRPEKPLFFYALYPFFGIAPEPYFIVILLLFALLVVLLYLLVYQLTHDIPTALVAALVLAIHREASFNMHCLDSHEDLMLALFTLGAIAFQRWRAVGGRAWTGVCALLCFVGALLSKESAVLLPLFLGLWFLADRQWRAASAQAGNTRLGGILGWPIAWAAVTVVYLLLWGILLYGLPGRGPSAHMIGEHVIPAGDTPAVLGRQLLAALSLPMPASPELWLPLLLGGIIVGLVLGSKTPLLRLGIAWMLLAMLPSVLLPYRIGRLVLAGAGAGILFSALVPAGLIGPGRTLWRRPVSYVRLGLLAALIILLVPQTMDSRSLRLIRLRALCASILEAAPGLGAGDALCLVFDEPVPELALSVPPKPADRYVDRTLTRFDYHRRPPLERLLELELGTRELRMALIRRGDRPPPSLPDSARLFLVEGSRVHPISREELGWRVSEKQPIMKSRRSRSDG